MITPFLLAVASLVSPMSADVDPDRADATQERLVFPAIPEQGLAYLIGLARDKIIRVPPVNAGSSRSLRPFRFSEKSMGSCVKASKIAAVRRAGGTALDMVTTDRQHIRAYLSDNCQAMQYYSGFYVEKASDGKICAGRDILHSRSGAQCTVKTFKILKPAD